MFSRRSFIKGLAAAAAVFPCHGMTADATVRDSFHNRVAELEKRYGGQLGVAVLDTATGDTQTYRGDQRFPICSTFKVLLAGLILARVDQGQDRLDRRIHYRASDLVVYSPETEKHVDDGMTLGAICHAAVALSDNTAANLLLDTCGGPGTLTHYLRKLDDPITRLDGHEPLCRSFPAGTQRNTTTPRAMLSSLHRVLLGNALLPESRRQLQSWMIASTTGAQRLRAGLPADWRVGDKTGSGCHATANDVAIAWPPHRPPRVISAYYTGSTASREQQSGVLAEIGAIATQPI